MYAFMNVCVRFNKSRLSKSFEHVEKVWRIKVSSIIRKHSFQCVNQSLSIRIAFVS